MKTPPVLSILYFMIFEVFFHDSPIPGELCCCSLPAHLSKCRMGKNPLFVTLKSGKEVEPSLLSFIYLFSTCEKDLNMRHLKPSIRGNA